MFKHLSVRGGFRRKTCGALLLWNYLFQSPRGEGVVQTNAHDSGSVYRYEFQSPRGEGVVQTANANLMNRTFLFQSPRGEGVVQTEKS